MTIKDTDISKNQNITFQEVAPFVNRANPSRVGALEASNKFNTLTNWIGLGADITADINKNIALADTGKEVRNVIDEYEETSPTNVLEAQHQIALRNKEREKATEGYNVTNETPTLLLEGVDKANQSFLIDIEEDIKFINKAKAQDRMSQVEAEARINDLYRKKLSQYPYLASEILQHGQQVRDLYGFNSLLRRDSELLKSMETAKTNEKKAMLDEIKFTRQEMKELSIPEEWAMVENELGESVLDIKLARDFIDSERTTIRNHSIAKRLSADRGFKKEEVLENINYPMLNREFNHQVKSYSTRVKNIISDTMAGEDKILGTKDDVMDENTRAMIATNLKSLETATLSRLTEEYSSYRVGTKNDRFDTGYNQMVEGIKEITKNLTASVTKTTLKDVFTNQQTIIGAIEELEMFNKFGTKIALSKALKEIMFDPKMHEWLDIYWDELSRSADPKLKAMGIDGKKALNTMIKQYVQISSMTLEGAKDNYSKKDLEKTTLNVSDKLAEMLLYSIENNTSDSNDNMMIDKYLNSITDKKINRSERVQTAYDMLAILADGRLTIDRVKKLRDDGRIVQVVDDTYKIVEAGLKDYFSKVPNSKESIIKNDDNLLSSTDSNLNAYLKPLNNIYKVNHIFHGKNVATERLNKLWDSLEEPETKEEAPAAEVKKEPVDQSSQVFTNDDPIKVAMANTGNNNLGNLKNPNDLSKFQSFSTREEGIIASAEQVERLYKGKHKNHQGIKINTVKGIIDVWRPKEDRRGDKDISQENYISIVAKALDVGSTDKLDLSNTKKGRDNMAKLLQAIFKVEGNPAELAEILPLLLNNKASGFAENDPFK